MIFEDVIQILEFVWEIWYEICCQSFSMNFEFLRLFEFLSIFEFLENI